MQTPITKKADKFAKLFTPQSAKDTRRCRRALRLMVEVFDLANGQEVGRKLRQTSRASRIARKQRREPHRS
ncbi:hypothetical protein CPT_Maja_068 [Burkholderia phage Maja]|uniref:Uncharacterized protein n=1 Tax=Burkholderia phage Maja TaxID=2767571 RepID=A0A7S6U1T7_9CAUD|nr:hypothetical protein CPT_Maja_068 [Burkholderia phage Maja]